MNEEQFHKRLKEILAANRSPHNSPDADVHEAMSKQVRGSSGEWDESRALQTIRGFEWMTGTQPKTHKISEPEVKKILSEFLESRSYKFTPIPEGEKMTPDGLIEKSGEEFVCEIKSPELNFDIEAQLYKFKTTHRKILDFVHTASKQFDTYDPEHNKPRAMIFTSTHSQLNWKSFTDAIQGGVVNQEGVRMPDFTKTAVYQSTQPLLSDADLYVWYQVDSNNEFFQASYFVNQDSEFIQECSDLVKDLSTPKISYMDNYYTVQFSKQ